MTYLLDVNVLIALIDPGHVAHDDAHAWFSRDGHTSWATCPITENGVARIIGNPKYPNSPGSSAVVAGIVAQLRALPGHCFWAEDFSLVGSEAVDASRILTSAQVTDTYLLALAKVRGGELASSPPSMARTPTSRFRRFAPGWRQCASARHAGGQAGNPRR